MFRTIQKLLQVPIIPNGVYGIANGQPH